MHRYRLLVAALWQALAFCLLVPAAHASTHIAAELVAETAVEPGKAVTLAFRMVPDEGWHGYWQNPGDAGLGLDARWSLPAGATVGELRYPVPETLIVSALMNHVYKGEYALLVDFRAPADASPGDLLPVTADAQWLACTDQICVPEQARLSTTIQVGAKSTTDPRFDPWRSRLPAPLGTRTNFALAGDMIRIGVPLPSSLALANPHFFPAEDKVADYAAAQVFRRKGNLLVIELQRARMARVTPDSLSGVLRLNGQGDGVWVEAAPGPVPAGGVPLSTSLPGTDQSLPLLLLAAIAGGLLLNVMPCVFPILSLKALSLARAGESPAQARAEGLAYTAGVVIACVGLGGVLLALRAAGEQVGWAFQLQEPGVVAALLFLSVAITANFLGLFELSIPGFAQAGSPQGAFATGLLAAFVATPCTGPFMAAAMGAALLLPVPQALLLFGSLGLGIALPFLIIAIVPAARRMLPRPGPWMVSFRRWMALPMALTTAALLWLASRLGGTLFALAIACLAGLLVVLLAAAGRKQGKGKGAAILLLPGLIVLGLTAFTALPRLATATVNSNSGILPSQPFSEAALARARASGKPVFAYFTADWCLTCKVNEEVAIEREDTRNAFAKAGVVVLKGDWTRRDPSITRYLTAQGAAGVPYYAWYPAGGGDVRQLPQVLTPAMLAALPAD